MSAFKLIASGVDVSRVNAELAAYPEMWGARGYRISDPTSPHHGVPDIWLRHRNLNELDRPNSHHEPHFAEFYPEWWALPSLHPIVYGLMAHMKAVYLGGILITKIPPGESVKPHSDAGGWHAEFNNHKLYLVLKANPFCINYCDGEAENFRQGDVWEFSNLVDHSVVNNGDTERQTVIISMRSEIEASQT